MSKIENYAKKEELFLYKSIEKDGKNFQINAFQMKNDKKKKK